MARRLIGVSFALCVLAIGAAGAGAGATAGGDGAPGFSGSADFATRAGVEGSNQLRRYGSEITTTMASTVSTSTALNHPAEKMLRANPALVASRELERTDRDVRQSHRLHHLVELTACIERDVLARGGALQLGGLETLLRRGHAGER